MFILVYAAQVSVIFSWMIYASLVPFLMQDLHLTYWQAGSTPPPVRGFGYLPAPARPYSSEGDL